jgi:hypothetical protein
MRETGNKIEGKEGGVKNLDESFENYQYFDCAVELFRFFIFKEESNFISQFRPVPTIEPETPDGHKQAPLFRLIYNTSF